MTERLKIATLDNRPYLAKGSLMLLDAEGDDFRAKRATVALCRCGGSTNKPFCDGTHSKAAKVEGLEQYGVEVVERVPLGISPNPSNLAYLQTKREKMGHLFPEAVALEVVARGGSA